MIYPGRDEQDKDLPMPWYRYFTDEGEEYFFNEETEETTWEHPCLDAGERTEELANPPAAADGVAQGTASIKGLASAQRPSESELGRGSGAGANLAPTHVSDESSRTGSIAGREEGEGGKSRACVASPVPESSNPFESSPSQSARPSESTVAVPIATQIHSIEAEPVHEQSQNISASVEAVPIPPTLTIEHSVTTSSSNPFGEEEEEEHAAIELRQPATSPPILRQDSQPSPLTAPPVASTRGTATASRNASAQPSRSPSNPFAEGPARSASSPAPSTARVASNPFASPSSAPPLNSRNPFANDEAQASPASSAAASAAVHSNPFAEEPSTSPTRSSAAEGSSILQELKARKAMAVGGGGSGSRGAAPASRPSHTPAAPPPRAMAAGEEVPAQPRKKQSDLLRELQAGTPSGVTRPRPPPPPSSSSSSTGGASPTKNGAAAPKAPRRSMAEAIVHAPHDQVASHIPLSNECKLLMQWGVRSGPAEAFLASNDFQLDKALQALNKQICEELYVDPSASMMAVWSPRLAIKIKSWLPNVMEMDGNDYHTGYVTTVGYTSLRGGTKSWQLTLRYNRFKAIHAVVSKYQKYTNLVNKFPASTLGQWFAGISDAVRYERMDAFDLWLREVTLNPVLMTIQEVVQIVYSTLMVHENIKEDF